MRIAMLLLTLGIIGATPARAAEPGPAAPDPPPAQGAEPEPNAVFKVERNLFGSRVDVDARGRCEAPRGHEIKVWYVNGFPAVLPHFESCTTLSSPTARGEAVVTLRLMGPEGVVREVEGVLDLGAQGRAHQAVNWDDIELPSAGRYGLEVEVDGAVVTRLPMRVEVRKARAPKKD